MKKIVSFVLYNNTFIFIIGGIILGAGTTMAANEDVRGQVARALVTEQTTVVSVDNQYILTADIENYPVTAEVISVEEDSEFYFVEYSLNTILIADGVWQPGTRTDSLQLEKVRLGNQDLGLYLAKQFDELITAEKRILVETRLEENAVGLSQKVAVTEYDGLVGRLMDSSTNAFPGYEPVIPAPVVAATEQRNSPVTVSAPVATQSSGGSTNQPSNQPAKPDSDGSAVSSTSATNTTPTNVDSVGQNSTSTAGTSPVDAAGQSTSGTTTTASTSVPSQPTSGTTTNASTSQTTVSQQQPDVVAPKLTLQGNNSLRLEVGEVYQESGSTAIDETDGDITSAIQSSGSVDTQTPGTYVIVYTVTDQAGNRAQKKRTIEVYELIEEQPQQNTQEAQAASST
jgi:hypothetical protein